MNHFLALALDEDTRDELAMLSGRMQAWGLPARWVHPEDMHLTLVFLGGLGEEAGEALVGRVAEVAGSLRRPELTISGVGAHAGRTEPRTVFAAVTDPDESCDAMRLDLCEVLGRTPESGYRPHVTLARPKPAEEGLPLFRDWPHLLEAHGLTVPCPCGVTDVVLYRSSGVGVTRYEVVESWPLND